MYLNSVGIEAPNTREEELLRAVFIMIEPLLLSEKVGNHNG